MRAIGAHTVAQKNGKTAKKIERQEALRIEAERLPLKSWRRSKRKSGSAT